MFASSHLRSNAGRTARNLHSSTPVVQHAIKALVCDRHLTWPRVAYLHERIPGNVENLSFVFRVHVAYRTYSPMNSVMHIRKLLASETNQLRAHLTRLTPEQRTLRFMGSVNDASIAEHCDRINWFRTVVIGFFDSGALRGAAELQIADHHVPILCEAGITVEKEWQDHGVATELLRRALLIARNRAARGVQIGCFGDNYRIQHVAEKFGAKFHVQAGETEAQIATPSPTYWSLREEAIADGWGWMSFWVDQYVPQRAPVPTASAGI